MASKKSLNQKNALAGGLEHPTGQVEPHIPVLLTVISSKNGVVQQRNPSQWSLINFSTCRKV